MKKLHFIIAMLLTTVCCMALFAACSHEHTFAKEWSYDETNHWHAATCKHTNEKSELSTHDLVEDVDTEDGTKFTCMECGYFEIRPSRYRVTADEYANLLGAVEKFRVDMDHDGLHTYRIISDVVFLASQGVSEYYCFVGNDLVYLVKYYDQEEYIEEKRDKEEYDSVKSNSNLLGYIADKFALLTYNLESKTYDAESLLIEEQGEYWAKFNDLSVSFEDGKLVSVKFIFALNTGAYTETAYEYSEIGTASAQFPETWHKHTYSEEWSYDEENHWHASNCAHEHASEKKSGLEKHDFNTEEVENGTKYTCSVCGYSDVRKSIYRIDDAETFDSLLQKVDKYRFQAHDGDISADEYHDGINVYTPVSEVYYIADNGNYYIYMGEKEYDEEGNLTGEFYGDYILQIATAEDFADNDAYPKLILSLIVGKFSSLSYDYTTKSYKGTNVVLFEDENSSIIVTELTIRFKEGALKEININFSEETFYSYSEIGEVKIETPKVHEHTYSDKWTIDATWHWHDFTCRHKNENYGLKPVYIGHTLQNGVCTECGFNVLKLSEDGKTVESVYGDAISFTFPEGVTAIGANAFAKLSVEEIVLPEGIETIGKYAFLDCVKLSSITLPSTLKTIDYSAFKGCTALTSVTIPSSVTHIDSEAFASSGLTSIVFPDSITSFSDNAIQYCKDLTTVKLPGCVKSINISIFEGCISLTTLVLSEGTEKLLENAFNDCTKLETIVLPASLTSIEVKFNSDIKTVYYGGNKFQWDEMEKVSASKDQLEAAKLYFYSKEEPTEEGNFWHYDDNGNIVVWHIHTFATEWSSNETEHWHAASCEHTDKKKGVAPHTFDDGVIDGDKLKYTCTVCGYLKTEESPYMVTEEEFASILNSAKKFKLVAIGESGYTVILGDVSYFEGFNRTRYYLFEGDKYYQVFQDMYNEWIKEEIEKSQYDYALSGYGILDALSEYYSYLEYDVETKSYKANAIGISPVGGGLVTTYYDMTVSFENKALKSVTYYLYINYGRVRQDCVYSGIGMENAVLPAIHEHTFAEEWSYDDQNHWHSSNCSHIYERSDEGKHTFEKGVCTVCGYNVLNISDDGKTLYGIPYGFDEDYDFNTFIIPKGVITISSGAFENYTKLTELDIPEGVTTIEMYAFYGCTGLTRISLPNTITSIGENAFANCSALKEIILPNNVTEFDLSAFADCSISIYYKGSKSDWENMTEGSDVMGDVTLNFYSKTDPADIGNFWYYDENGNISAWSVHTFAEEWSHDENNHWRVTTCEHTGIKGMFGPHTFDNGVVDGDKMHYTCTACGYLKTEESPYLVTKEEFKNILNSVNIFKVKVSGADNFTAILNDVRYYESNDSIIYYIFENGEYYAISKDGDQWVKDETAKESYDSISNYNLFAVFSESFSEFTFDLKTMSYNAYCIKITDENGHTVFYYEVSVSFENNAVTSLAFNISNYELNFEYSEIGTASKDLPADIHEHTFNEEWWCDDSTHCHYATCEHGTATKDSGFHTFEKGVCTECGFNALIVSDDGTTVTGISNGYDDDGHRLVYNGFTVPEGVTTIGEKLFYENYDITEIVIPEGVTAIEEYAFAYCSNLTTVILPSTLKTMASHAFAWCTGLTEIFLPSTLTDIGENCFEGCTGLTEITIPSGVTEISNDLFNGCTSLKTVILPDTVTSIGSCAFCDCAALTEMVIPNSVIKMDYGVIWKSAISKIYYGGTQDEFDKIGGVKSNITSESTITVYFYSETAPETEGNYWHYVNGEATPWNTL